LNTERLSKGDVLRFITHVDSASQENYDGLKNLHTKLFMYGQMEASRILQDALASFDCGEYKSVALRLVEID
jgi:hypothetical protein